MIDNSEISDKSYNDKDELIHSILTWNEQLENNVNSATNRAFNLGCFVGIVPIITIVMISYFLIGKSWVGTIVVFILMLLGLILVANVLARTTRINTLQRVYQENIRPKYLLLLNNSSLNNLDLNNIALNVLEPGTPLRELLETDKDLPGKSPSNNPNDPIDSVNL